MGKCDVISDAICNYLLTNNPAPANAANPNDFHVIGPFPLLGSSFADLGTEAGFGGTEEAGGGGVFGAAAAAS